MGMIFWTDIPYVQESSPDSFYQCWCSTEKIIETLLIHKADVNKSNKKGESPLALCSMINNKSAVKILLKYFCFEIWSGNLNLKNWCNGN